MILKKWNYEKHKYLDYEVPNEWRVSLFESDMNTLVNCPHCGNKIKFSDTYTSLEFHNWAGLGFAVCEKCYNKEWEKREKYKGDNNEKI